MLYLSESFYLSFPEIGGPSLYLKTKKSLFR